MKLDDLSQSGIRRIADYSPYLDQLAGLAQDMGLRQRSNLVQLEQCLHQHWSLGQNNILSWAPLDEGILILVLPHYAIAEYTAPHADDTPAKVSSKFITELISGARQLTFDQIQKVEYCVIFTKRAQMSECLDYIITCSARVVCRGHLRTRTPYHADPVSDV